MGNPSTGDVGVLLPAPFILRVGGEELRQQALPGKRLLRVVQYLQDNADLLDKVGGLAETKGADGMVDFVGFLETEVFRRMNGLVRLFYDDVTAAKMTDEWCLEHLTPAHFAIIIKMAIRQNQLEYLFQKAGEFLDSRLGEFLRDIKL